MDRDGNWNVVSENRAFCREDISFDDVLSECVADPDVVWAGVVF